MGKILIADDAPFFRTMLKDVLVQGGHEIFFAEDGEEAVQKAQELNDQLDLLILDMVLPKKTGLEVLMDLIDSPFKILCITGSEMVHEFEDLKELGATNMVNKSSPVEDIIYMIDQLIYKDKTEQKRVNKRILLKVQINFRTPDQAFTSNTFTLSCQGVFIQSEKLIPEKTEIGISFYLPTGEGGGKEINCQGTVVQAATGEKDGAVKGMAVVFKDLSEFDQQVIHDYVEMVHAKKG